MKLVLKLEDFFVGGSRRVLVKEVLFQLRGLGTKNGILGHYRYVSKFDKKKSAKLKKMV